MERFLDDYWYIILGIIIWIFSSVFGNKKKGAQKQVQQKSQGNRSASRPASTLEARLEEFARKIEEATAQASNNNRSSGRSEPPPLVSEASQAPARQMPRRQPTAIGNLEGQSVTIGNMEGQSVTLRGMEGGGIDEESRQESMEFHEVHGIQHVHFDQETDAFTYRSASKPAQHEYFATDFSSFTQAKTIGTSAPTVSADESNDTASAINDMFGDLDQVQRAIILNEILSKPKSIRGV